MIWEELKIKAKELDKFCYVIEFGKDEYISFQSLCFHKNGDITYEVENPEECDVSTRDVVISFGRTPDQMYKIMENLQ